MIAAHTVKRAKASRQQKKRATSNMEALRVEWRIPPEVTMGKIERVRLYLKGGRCVENVFLIDRRFALYYLADELVAVANPMDLTYATPTKNIQNKLGFTSEEVLIVQSSQTSRLAGCSDRSSD